MIPKLNFCDPNILQQFFNLDELLTYLKESGDQRFSTKSKAKQWLFEHIPHESYYQDKIINYLNALPVQNFTAKIAQGPYSKSGIPDIHFETGGRCIHFEVKRPFIGEESSVQRITRQKITASGGSSYVVTFVKEVETILAQEGVI